MSWLVLTVKSLPHLVNLDKVSRLYPVEKGTCVIMAAEESDSMGVSAPVPGVFFAAESFEAVYRSICLESNVYDRKPKEGRRWWWQRDAP